MRRLQANPVLGAFRVHAALEQLGIHLSPPTCGAILAEHRALGIGRLSEPNTSTTCLLGLPYGLRETQGRNRFAPRRSEFRAAASKK